MKLNRLFVKFATLMLFVALLEAAWISAAHAGIETIATTVIVSLLTAAGVSAAVATTIAPFVLAAAVIGGALLLGGSQGDVGGANAAIDPAKARDTFESSAGPELNAVGRVKLGGLKGFGNSNGSNRYRITLHCKGEIDAIEEYYLGGREVTVDPDGSVTSPPWARASGSDCYVKSKTGTGSETAWSELISEFPALWTSDHRIRGIAHSLVQYVSPGYSSPRFLKLYQSGVPDLEVVIRADKSVYDPRTDATAWTENGILNAYRILFSYSEFTIADVDTAFMATEADRADVLIETLDGDVARARACGIWSSETARGTNLAKVLDSIGGRIVPRDGGEKIGIELIDDDPVAEVTIPLRHIIAIDWRSGPEGVERPNICRLKFYCPARNYEMAEVDFTGIAWARVEDEITAYGDKIFDVELLFCPNSGQAQRRARQMFAMARADSGTIKTNMAGLAVWGARNVAFEFPDDLGTKLCLIGAPRVLDDQGQVEIPFIVWPTLSEWDPEVDEAEAPAAIPDLAYGSPLTVPDAPTAATVVTYQGAGGYATRVAYATPGDAPSVEASYRTYTGGLPNAWTSMTEVVSAGGFVYATAAVDLTGLDADFRIRTYDGDDTVSIWSDLLHTTLAADNTAPMAPRFTIEATGDAAGDVTVDVPDALNVAYLSFTGDDAPANTNVVLRQTVSWAATASGVAVSVGAMVRSSNGTGGASVGGTVPATSAYVGQFVTVTPNSASSVTITFGGSPYTNVTSGPSRPFGLSPPASFTASGLGSGTHTWSLSPYADLSTPGGNPMTVSITIP